MSSRPSPKVLLHRGIRLAALIGLAAAGAVAAQPAPPAPPEESAPKSGASEEAPPINVPTPAPIAAPPISEKEVAPAAPPVQAEPKAPGVPVRRNRYDVAVIEAIDKVTAESLRFEAAVNRPIRYKSLIFTVKACERSTPEEAIDDSIAYLTIDSQPRPLPGKPELSPRQAFRGWMYASSPGLHPLEHPVYDAWLITCRAAAPPIAPAR
ncbi:DUF2155 domain-containing protein [Phenylobacterium sp.]|uniref:DUF2155 domain-containing protein n=1 Tax=Phenylobacterium sp. TaxID=1871053 RepID=UPI002F42CA44